MSENWKDRISRAKAGDIEAAAGLYSAAAAYLRHFGHEPGLADRLEAIVRVVRRLTPYSSSDHYARAIAKAAGLNRKLWPTPNPQTKENLEASELPEPLAAFIAGRLTAATLDSRGEGTVALRARRVTSALLLNRPVGSPRSEKRSHEPALIRKMIHVEQSTRFPGGDFEVELDKRDQITPDRVAATVAFFLEPPRTMNVKEACRQAAEKLNRPVESVEVIFYRERRKKQIKK